MDYEMYPRAGLGPFRLGMAQEGAEKLQDRLGPSKSPGSFCLEYEEGCLPWTGPNMLESIRVLYRGRDLIHAHVEGVIATLSKESDFVCDCVDHDLADAYNFPVLELELRREEPYRSKLLREPSFQYMVTRGPLTGYQRGWYFLQV